MRRLKDKLDMVQSRRLFYRILVEPGGTVRDIHKKTGLAVGTVGTLNPDAPCFEPATKAVLYQICEAYGKNPYWVLYGDQYPKDVDWEKIFNI